jgi:RimJ/RimL family protein N-acetyltransferase
VSDFNPGPVELRGRYVTLTPVEPGHFEDLWLQAQDRDIWTWMLNEPPLDRVSFKSWFDEMLQSHETGRAVAFSVMVHGRAVGSTRLFDFRPKDRGLEIGYTWYGPEARGTHVNPESKLLLLEHCFENLQCNRVQLKTDERNERSRRAMLKMGAKFEGILRNYQTREDGFCRNTAMFSVIRSEWPEVKAALEARLAG